MNQECVITTQLQAHPKLLSYNGPGSCQISDSQLNLRPLSPQLFGVWYRSDLTNPLWLLGILSTEAYHNSLKNAHISVHYGILTDSNKSLSFNRSLRIGLMAWLSCVLRNSTLYPFFSGSIASNNFAPNVQLWPLPGGWQISARSTQYFMYMRQPSIRLELQFLLSLPSGQ